MMRLSPICWNKISYFRPYRRLLILCVIGPILLWIIFSQKRNISLRNEERFRSPDPTNLKLERNGYLAIDYRSVDISGLGNKLFELLATIGIAESLNRIPYIHVKNPGIAKLGKVVRPIFPKIEEQFKIVYWDITVKNVTNFQPTCCFYNTNTSRLIEYKEEYLLLNGRYFQSYKYFDHLRQEIKQWLLPSESVQTKAISNLPLKYRKSFVICVHIRRGDFKTDPHHSATDGNSTLRAINYLVAKYRRPMRRMTTAIMGDDKKWATDLFKGQKRSSSVAVVNNTMEEEFAFTRIYCDVVLITAPSSTFGWFMACLAKGKSIYYLDPKGTSDKTALKIVEKDYFLPEWVKLKVGKNKIEEFPSWGE